MKILYSTWSHMTVNEQGTV